PPWDFHRDGHEVFGAIQLEVIDFHCDGEFRNRLLQHQRILKLPLLVGGSEFAELFGGEITLSVIQIAGRAWAEGDFDASEFSVLSRVGGVIPKNVVARKALLSLHDAPGQVVVVKQSFSASVPSEG